MRTTVIFKNSIHTEVEVFIRHGSCSVQMGQRVGARVSLNTLQYLTYKIKYHSDSKYLELYHSWHVTPVAMATKDGCKTRVMVTILRTGIATYLMVNLRTKGEVIHKYHTEKQTEAINICWKNYKDTSTLCTPNE